MRAQCAPPQAGGQALHHEPPAAVRHSPHALRSRHAIPQPAMRRRRFQQELSLLLAAGEATAPSAVVFACALHLLEHEVALEAPRGNGSFVVECRCEHSCGHPAHRSPCSASALPLELEQKKYGHTETFIWNTQHITSQVGM